MIVRRDGSACGGRYIRSVRKYLGTRIWLQPSFAPAA
jgi:hypothetical protein